MKLEVFDKHTRLRIGIINAFTYVKYEDDYCGTGSFEITIPTAEESLDYLAFGNYIFFETGVLGVIKGVTDTEDSDVEVKVYGYLTNHILQYRSFLLTTKYYNSIGNIARQMVTDLFINPRDIRRKISYVTLSSDPRYIPAILGNVTVQNTGSTLFDVLNEIFLQYDLGFELYPVLENTNNGSMLTELQFRIITPVDRTINNTQNNVPVVFSFDLDNLQSLEYEEDGRAYNNVAIVASEGEGETRKVLEVGDRTSTGIDRIELYIDARDIQYDSGTLALEEIDSLEDSLQDVATSGEYSDLYNQPSINGNVLVGNKTSAELGIITETVDNLTNYYLKSQTYTQAEVNALINNALNGLFEIVATLPTQDISTHTIYLAPASTTATNNYYNEYMYISNQWELIGSTQIDLSDYVTTQSLNTTLASYVTTQSLNTTLSNYVTSQSLNTTLANYPTNTALETVTGDLSDLQTTDKSDLVAAINEVAQGGGGTTVEQLFVATYGVTTYAEIEAAYNARKLIVVSRELNGITWYIFTDRTTAGIYYFRSFSNATATNYGCYINSSGTWSVNSYAYATLSSPAFTGTPTAPTAASGTNTTQIATTAFVQSALSSIPNVAFYVVDLNSGQWAKTDTVIDKGHVYKSTNEGIQSSAYSCTISIIGFKSFTIMARSNGESNYDYAEIGALDAATITRNGSGNVKTFKGSPSTTYTAVTFDNLDGGFHTIKVLYSKDGSQNSNEDAGFFYIPNQLDLGDLVSGGGGGSIATSAEISAIANRTYSS